MSFLIEKLVIDKNVYQQATCLIEWNLLSLDEKSYTVVRITLSDRAGKPIYDHPMLLLTNISVRTPEQRRSIYRIYLHRAKIEGLFKSLKSVLGWEKFQVKDYESIKNIIALYDYPTDFNRRQPLYVVVTLNSTEIVES